MARSALITGCHGGIGVALCQAFAAARYRVIGLDIATGEAASVSAMIVADLGRMVADSAYANEILHRIRSALGSDRLAALVNNAAVQELGRSEDLTVDTWRRTLDVNLLAPFVLTRELLTDLEAAKGSVINISSVHGVLTKPGFVAYATSKSALAGMTRALAVDLGGRVRVNAILPAAIATPMLEAGFAGNPDGLSRLASMHPLDRIGQPTDVADAAVFLASKAAGFITGATLAVDGGILSRLHDPE